MIWYNIFVLPKKVVKTTEQYLNFLWEGKAQDNVKLR